MASIELKAVSKTFGKNTVVNDANISVADGEFLALVGPSGCGKSTLLRMISGLETIDKGSIIIDEIVVNNVPPKDRDIAMVFQNYALYPHMSVYDNLAFGLKMKGVEKETINTLVENTAELLDITELLERKPKQLSGGQKQRIAVGRAIIRNPKAFLFDEPLSNLDAKLRVKMRADLLRLHKKQKATSIYVTHDQVEAMTMADRIAIMNKGEVQQIDTPIEVYKNPENLFVASFIGSPSMNFLTGKIESEDSKLTFHTHTGSTQIILPESISKLLPSTSYDDIILGIRPEDIALKDANAQHSRITNISIELIEHMGDISLLHFSPEPNVTWVAKTPPSDSLKVGDNIDLFLDTNKIHFFDVSTEENLML
jgi:multiple sugar transport system ATP-binding protein